MCRATPHSDTGVVEDVARRRWHIGVCATRTLASEIYELHPIAAPARSVCSPIAARTLPTDRASCAFPR
eukprot:5712944-Prymnesium_polylepis.1